LMLRLYPVPRFRFNDQRIPYKVAFSDPEGVAFPTKDIHETYHG
jgi:hypothetical protein